MMSQELGRVNHLQLALPEEHGYYIYVNVNTLIYLWMRTQGESNVNVRDRHVRQFMETMTMLLLPNQCYHEFLEQTFENLATY